jgi:hypothetical protein
MTAHTKAVAVASLVDKAGRSMAHLYVWDAVVMILAGTTSPGRECAAAQKSVEQVLRICDREKTRCLERYDAAMTKARELAR